MGRNLTNLPISASFQYLLQVSGSEVTDGLGVDVDNLTVTASYATQALTASFAENVTPIDTGSLMETGSVTDATLTFTKADASTFDLTVDNVTSASFAATASLAQALEGGVSLQTVLDTGNTATASIDLDGDITADNFLGNASTATTASYVETADKAQNIRVTPSGDVSDGNRFLLLSTTNSGTNVNVLADGTSNIRYQSGDNTLVVDNISATDDLLAGTATLGPTTITGNTTIGPDGSGTDKVTVNTALGLESTTGITGSLLGDVTGNVTGDVTGDLTGNADTATSASHAVMADTASFLPSDTNLNINTISASSATFQSASIGFLQTVTGSATIIGDNYIILNTSDATRYAGIAVEDSGSATPTNYTASWNFDSQTNDWFYEYTGSDDTDFAIAMFGPEYSTKGSPTYLTNNTIPKGDGGHHLNDSNITDDGSKVEVSVPMADITLSGSKTIVSGSFDIVLPTDANDVNIINPDEKLALIVRGGIMAGSDETLSTDPGFNNHLFGERITAYGATQTAGALAAREVDFGGNLIEYSAFVATQNSSFDGANKSLIAGGNSNTIDTEDSVGEDNVILGGASHRIGAGERNTIVGGRSNTIVEGNNRVIIGGNNNTLGYDSGVAEYSGSVIVGGTGHLSKHNNTVILGGSNITSSADNTVYVPNLTLTGSGATLTFDDGTTMTTAVTDPFPYTGSAIFSGSIELEGPLHMTGSIEMGSNAINFVSASQTGSVIDNVHPAEASSSAQINHIVSLTQGQYDTISGSGAAYDDTFYIISDANDQVIPDNLEVAGQIFSPVAEGSVSSATSSIDFNDGNFASLDLTVSTFLANPSNLKSGTTYTIILDSGSLISGHGDAFKFAGGTAPTYSDNTDVLTMVSDGTNLYATALTDFS